MGCVQSLPKKQEQRNVKLPKLKKDVYSPHKASQAGHGVPKDGGPVPITPYSDTSALLGVAKVLIESAELHKKGHYNVTLSLGLQVRSCYVELPRVACVQAPS